jgi:APA family basic amino acid/polyamine antiporter
MYLQTMTAKSNQLNLFDLSMIVVSLVIGMGIFRNPASVAATTGNSSIFFLVWIAGGVIALCGALTFAEISHFPAAITRTLPVKSSTVHTNSLLEK